VPRKRLNPSLAKINRNYSVEEIARLYDVDRQTVRAWLKSGDLTTIDDRKPYLVQGRNLRSFLEKRRAVAKRPCPPGTLYCLGCRQPRRPALQMADFIERGAAAGNLRAICEACGSVMHRRARREVLSSILPDIEVRLMEEPPRIAELPPPSLNHHSRTNP